MEQDVAKLVGPLCHKASGLNNSTDPVIQHRQRNTIHRKYFVSSANWFSTLLFLSLSFNDAVNN